MTGPVVRPARPEDLPAIMRLFRVLADHQQAWRVFPPRPTLASEMESNYRAAIDDPDALLLLAEGQDREVVGMALGRLHRPSTFSDEVAVELSTAVVLPASRGQGVGKVLSDEIRRFAHREGARYVTLKTFAQNERGLAFWTRNGFVPRMIQMVAPALISEDDPPG